MVICQNMTIKNHVLADHLISTDRVKSVKNMYLMCSFKLNADIQTEAIGHMQDVIVISDMKNV